MTRVPSLHPRSHHYVFFVPPPPPRRARGNRQTRLARRLSRSYRGRVARGLGTPTGININFSGSRRMRTREMYPAWVRRYPPPTSRPETHPGFTNSRGTRGRVFQFRL